MSIKYKFNDQDRLYFISFSVINWIDLFIRNEYKQILLDSWKHCQLHKGLEIFGWCIMTSHVHMIIGTRGDKLENIMRDMKKYTSACLKEAIMQHNGESRKEWMLWMMERAGKKNSQNLNFQLWRQDNHPVELTSLKMAHQKLDYIHNNPVEAGFVANPEDFIYSSARDYYGSTGLINIMLLEPLTQ